MLIYPASHDQVKRTLSRFYKSLTAALDAEPSITLTVLKEGLAVNDRTIGAGTAVFVDLATVLKHYQIAALTFSKGLEPKEIVGFLRLISTDREKINAEGGIAVIAGKRPFPHIQIQIVDYSKLQLTVESEIQRSSRRDPDGSIWQDFVSNLLTDDDAPDHGASATRINLDPKELADMLNRQILNPTTAVSRYEQMLVRKTDNDSEMLDMQLTEGLLHFQQMIRELNPDLQNQFLATTFNRCAQTENISKTAHLIDGLGAELIMRMLHQASSAGKHISPSLIAFVNKIGELPIPAGPIANGAAPGDTRGLSSGKIESLLTPEQYDTYVDSDYNRMLNSLASSDRKSELGPETGGLREELAADLSDAGINAHVGRAMSRLMRASEDLAGYRDWARQLAYLLDDLLESQAFDYLTELMAFAQAEQGGDDKERSQIAELLLDRFSDPQFVAKTIDTVQKSDGNLSPEALEFLMELGEPVVLEIFDSLDLSLTLHNEGVLVQILKNLSSYTAQEALERLKDPRPDYVIRMLRILHKLGDSESAQQVRSLLDHQDQEVRMEALATLLKFNINWGMIRLRELLERPLEAEFKPALQLAGEYRVRAVVPQLLSYFERRYDIELREATLRTLGRIGDPRAIPALTKLAHRRWSISKKQIDRLKRVLFETLEGYPPGDIKHLLHFGLKQKDTMIQSACQKILRQGARASGGS